MGWDQPMRTYYAQLWDSAFDPDFDLGAPAKAAGYHEAEKIAPLAGEYGPYPITTIAALEEQLASWGVAQALTSRRADELVRGRELAQKESERWVR